MLIQMPTPIPVDESAQDPAPGKKPRKPRQLRAPAQATQSSARLAQRTTSAPEEAQVPNDPTPPEPTDASDMVRPPDVVHVFLAHGAEPRHYNDAIVGEVAKKWKLSMKREWDSLSQLGMFTLVKLPAVTINLEGRG